MAKTPTASVATSDEALETATARAIRLHLQGARARSLVDERRRANGRKCSVTLTALSPNTGTLENRGSDNAAKQIMFGDAMRQRVSSQWLKAGFRYLAYCNTSLSTIAERYGLQRCIRSRLIFPLKVNADLQSGGFDAADAKRWSGMLASLFLKKEAAADETVDVGQNGQVDAGAPETDAAARTEPATALAAGATQLKGRGKPAKARGTMKREEGEADHGMGYLTQPIVLGRQEIDALVAVARELKDMGLSPEEAKALLQGPKGQDRLKPRDQIKKEMLGSEAVKGLAPAARVKVDEAADRIAGMISAMPLMIQWAGVEAALYGRFSTADLFSTVRGAVAVSHGIGVTPLIKSTDYVYVGDDLSEDHAAANINTTEVTTGLRHQALIVDLDQLWTNLGTAASVEAVGDILHWMIGVLGSGVPGAKLGSTAPFQAAEALVVEVGSHMPRQHVGAFVQSIRPTAGQDLYDLARDRLGGYVASMDERHGAPMLRVAMRHSLGKDKEPLINTTVVPGVRQVAERIREWITTEWVSPDQELAAPEMAAAK